MIEFPRNLPALLVTLDFYYECTGKKHGSVPVVILGPKTVRAKFPGKQIMTSPSLLYTRCTIKVNSSYLSISW